MNPLHFLPQDLEDIIINYKEQLEKDEHKKYFQKTLNILSDNEIYNMLNENSIVTLTHFQKELIENNTGLIKIMKIWNMKIVFIIFTA